MQTSNPFETIMEKLDRLQMAVDILSVNTAAKKKHPEPPDSNRILNLTEAAKILCKPTGTVRGYIHSRQLPAKLVGKSYLIKYSELMEWFERQEGNAPPNTINRMRSIHNRYRK